jgi:hypothetical protein
LTSLLAHQKVEISLIIDPRIRSLIVADLTITIAEANLNLPVISAEVKDHWIC